MKFTIFLATASVAAFELINDCYVSSQIYQSHRVFFTIPAGISSVYGMIVTDCRNKLYNENDL
jgi:hypothetical protein